jgi:hypothetical protein
MCLVALALVVVMVAVATTANATSPKPGRRHALLSRKGAELSAEVPRFGLPVEDAYSGKYGIDDGWGFGFGVMFSFTDRLLGEARMLQTQHAQPAADRDWDLDQAFVGVRYLLRTEDKLQPYIAIGGSRLALEWNPADGNPNDFERLTGFRGDVLAFSASLSYRVPVWW